MNLFDLLPEDDEMRVKHSAIKSTDWKWTMKDDYPKETNGLKVFSPGDCFDIHGEFIYVGSGGEIVAMIRTDIINYVCISEKKE